MPERRNWIARSAIMRKGGVHQKSRSAERQKEKRKLQKQVSEAIRSWVDSSGNLNDESAYLFVTS
jgi:hypothetical protein